MKKMLRFVRVVATFTILVALMTTSTFASPLINVVSPEEAAELALFYYCMNSSDKELVTLDEYVVTPLYDENEGVTYYAIDFFLNNENQGYVVIGGNLNHFQCPEFSLEGSSVYYQNAVQNKETIYYNPFQVFTTSDRETYYDYNNQEVACEDVRGVVYDGELLKNRSLLQDVSDSENSLSALRVSQIASPSSNSRDLIYTSDDPTGNRIVFSMHPLTYLETLGYTNVYTDSYGTIESTMTAADAFNTMYGYPFPHEITPGVYLNDTGHCGLTAISNVLMYWGYTLCSLYPDTYDEMFSTVLNYAVQHNKFDNVANGDGMSGNEIADTILGVSNSYTYSGDVYTNSSEELSFLKDHIQQGHPVIMGFSTDYDTFAWGENHVTVAFGYNVMKATSRYGYECQYSFVKLFDGHSQEEDSGKVYVCWDMIEASEYYPYDPGAEVEHVDPIEVYMISFVP